MDMLKSEMATHLNFIVRSSRDIINYKKRVRLKVANSINFSGLMAVVPVLTLTDIINLLSSLKIKDMFGCSWFYDKLYSK